VEEALVGSKRNASSSSPSPSPSSSSSSSSSSLSCYAITEHDPSITSDVFPNFFYLLINSLGSAFFGIISKLGLRTEYYGWHLLENGPWKTANEMEIEC